MILIRDPIQQSWSLLKQHLNFSNLQKALKNIFTIIKKQKFKNKTILFSPSAASFDSFKNFEERGFYFNKLIKKYHNGIQ